MRPVSNYDSTVVKMLPVSTAAYVGSKEWGTSLGTRIPNWRAISKWASPEYVNSLQYDSEWTGLSHKVGKNAPLIAASDLAWLFNPFRSERFCPEDRNA